MKRVLIVEDQVILADFLRCLVKDRATMSLVGLARDGYEALELWLEHRPDITILDMDLPRLNGLEILRRIKREDKGAYVMVFTAYGDEVLVGEALRASADAILEKETSLEEFQEALGFAELGEAYFTAEMRKKMGGYTPIGNSSGRF